MSNVMNMDLRAQRSRLALLDAGIDLLLTNPNASLSDVASYAGVGLSLIHI